MTKIAPSTILLTTIVFIAINFSTSKFQSFSRNIQFGFPFTFFTSEPEKLIGASNSFSALNLSLDILSVLICCGIIVKFLSVQFRHEKNAA